MPAGGVRRSPVRGWSDQARLAMFFTRLAVKEHLRPDLHVRPLVAELFLTDNCNLKCISCACWRTITRGELDGDEWRDVLDQLAALGILKANFTGGEPLLRRDAPELMAHACRVGIRNLHLNTNAVLLDEARLSAVLDAGVRSFNVPVDSAEHADLPAGTASAVLAMGSLQYADDFGGVLYRVATWLRPGGVLCLLTDGLTALVAELLRAGREQEALDRLASRRGLWRQGAQAAELHLMDAAALRGHVRAAGLVSETLLGLLVGATVHGREGLQRRLEADYHGALAAEWELAQRPELVDLGKQLLVVAARPVTH